MQGCQCCGSQFLVDAHPSDRIIGGRRLIAFLCARCYADKHRLEACTVCPTFQLRWQCSWLQHFTDAHPGLVEKLHNDPFPEYEWESPIKSLGTWHYQTDGKEIR